MTKTDAIKLFGTVKELATGLGISRQAIYQWGDDLGQDQADRIIGAAVRVGKIKPLLNYQQTIAE